MTPDEYPCETEEYKNACANMTPTPETHKRSALYMLAHDEWCSHDEPDDGIECDCHLSVIASLRKRLVQMERALADRDRRIDGGDAIPASFYKRLEAAENTDWHKAWADSVFRHAATIDKLAKAEGRLGAIERAFENQQFLIGTIEDERDALYKRLEAAMEGYTSVANDNATLRKRLEAAEKVRKAAQAYLNIHRSLPPVDDTPESWSAQMNWDLERDLLGDELCAALAGEK